MICPKCGKAFPQGAKFCGSCGTAASSAPAVTHRQPRRKKHLPAKKLLLPVFCVAALAVVIVLAVTVFGKKTVYLTSETVTDNPTMTQTVKTEYDELGQVVSTKTTAKYHDEDMTLYNSTYQRKYEYDENGRLLSVKVKSGSETYKIEYDYDKNGLPRSIECDGAEAEVACDKNGRITEISWESGSAEYSYHKNGALEEAELDYGTVAYRYVYDEAGNQLEMTTYVLGEKQSVEESTYNEDGQLLTQTSLSYSEGKKISEITTVYRYDRSGLPEQIELQVSTEVYDIVLYMQAEEDGLRREFYIVDASADREAMEEIGVDDTEEFLEFLDEKLDGEPMMVTEYDEHGNVLKLVTAFNSSETSYEYTAVKVPRDYRKTTAQDPFRFVPPIR